MQDHAMPETERDVIIESGPDKGKHFIIKLMSAYAGDRWARKLAAACGRSAAHIPEDVMRRGPGAFADMSIAIFGHIEENIREELFDQLMKCVKIKRTGIPSPNDVGEIDFLDPFTLNRVREEAFSLNINFIRAAVSQLSLLIAAASVMGTTLSPEPAPNAET